MIYAVTDAIQAGHIAACTDISDGGLLVALCEMMLGSYAKGRLGVSMDLSGVETDLRWDKWLFSETGGFVMEVKAGHEDAVARIMGDYGLELTCLGEVTEQPNLTVNAGNMQAQIALDDIRHAWADALAEALS